MKAFLLAAGFGSRLKPITNTIPKCLISIRGHSMLDWWAKLLEESGVTEILINTHYLSEQVHDYIEKFNLSHENIQYIEYYESELLGSGGTIWANRDFIKQEEAFFICYADNLCNVNLKNMLIFHREKRADFTMALFRTNLPNQCGIAKVNADSKIVEFEEKPQNPKSNLANAGIYVATNKIFTFFPDKKFVDLGKDVLPMMTGQMYGWETMDYLIDIGTIPNYEKAKDDWKYDYYKDALTY